MKRDDGIKFQWGKKYIKALDVTSEGGKYWKYVDNEKKNIVTFQPPELRFQIFVSTIINVWDIKKFKVLKNYKIKFKHENDLNRVVSELDNDYWKDHKIFVKEINKLILTLNVSPEIIEEYLTVG